jgi:protein-export membrane protein SecD
MSDRQLVLAAIGGNEQAFSSLVQAHQQALVASAWQLTRNREDAEDLALETCVEAYRHLRSLKEADNFRAWLFIILRNKCYRYLRQRHPENSSLEEHADTLAAPVPLHAGVELFELAAQLPYSYREVLIARYVYDLSYAEIAEALGSSERAVRVRCVRAREQLRQLAQRAEAEESALLQSARALVGGITTMLLSRVNMEVGSTMNVHAQASQGHPAQAPMHWAGWQALSHLAPWKTAVTVTAVLIVSGMGSLLLFHPHGHSSGIMAAGAVTNQVSKSSHAHSALEQSGGMRVVLAIPNHALFTYTLTPPLAGPREAAGKQRAMIKALADPAIGMASDTQDGNLLSVVVLENSVQVTTLAKNADIAKSQLQKVNAVMAQLFAYGQYSSSDPNNIMAYYKPVDSQLQETVRNIMMRRVNPDGRNDVQAYANGLDQVVVEIPGEKDPEHVTKLIGATAWLEFRLVPNEMSVDVQRDANGQTRGLTITEHGKPIADKEVIAASYLVLPGSALKPSSEVTYDQARNPAVSFSIGDQQSRERFSSIISAHIGENLAFVLDNKIIVAPVIKDAIPGDGIISGGFPTLESARELATLLNAGALPVPVRIVESRIVSPTDRQGHSPLTSRIMGVGTAAHQVAKLDAGTQQDIRYNTDTTF